MVTSMGVGHSGRTKQIASASRYSPLVTIISYPVPRHGCLDPAENFRALGESFFRLGEAEPQDPVVRRLAVEHRDRYRRHAPLLGESDSEVHVLLVAHGVVGEVLEEGAARGQGLE